jgi:hypothetical protein
MQITPGRMPELLVIEEATTRRTMHTLKVVVVTMMVQDQDNPIMPVNHLHHHRHIKHTLERNIIIMVKVRQMCLPDAQKQHSKESMTVIAGIGMSIHPVSRCRKEIVGDC